MDRKEYLEQIDAVIESGKYKPDWDSLAGRSAPEWMREGKFGIFIHWGVYSVPAFNNEWYSRNMYVQGSPEFEHHRKTYGEHKDFGYKDFIPLFKAESFAPEKWAELFQRAGAKYVVPVAEHHDGFQMYKSELSHWNAYKMGPKCDVLDKILTECEKRGIARGASSHRAEHWFFMGHGKEFDSDIKDPMQLGDFYWPAMPEPSFQDLHSEPAPTDEYLEDWLLRCCEIVDNYKPKLFYFDWWIQHSAIKPYLKKFAAYYYNRAAEWGVDAAICYKHDAFQFGAAVVDIERGKFAEAQPFFWQTDTAIARNSWCWTENNTFKSATEIICDLVDVVSKNGALLLNVGPKPDGTISAEDTAVLLEIGEWFRINGEAIYGTSIWRKSSEGPTKTREGQFTDSEAMKFTPEDIRFTVKGSCLYATVLSWPYDGQVSVRSLAEQDASHLPVFHGVIRGVEILGHGVTGWKRDADGLHVSAPNIKTDKPVVLKIQID